jgi:hypothetical protein
MARVDAIENASLQKFYLETVAMPFEAERIVKSVGVFSLQIAREGELVAVCLSALLHGALHHGSTDATPLMTRMDCDVCDNPRSPSTLCHVVHDEQLVCADDGLIDECNENPERGILLEHGKMSASFGHCEIIFSANACGTIDFNDGGNILFAGFADDDSVHRGSLQRLC